MVVSRQRAGRAEGRRRGKRRRRRRRRMRGWWWHGEREGRGRRW